MNQQSDIKIIRLNTGEDIVASCIEDEANGTILIASPMHVIVRRMSETSQTMLVMMPWLPLEIIEEDLASINYQDIITIVEPKSSFIEYYINTVDNYKALIESRDDELFESELEDEEVDEDTMQEMLDLLKERKKNSIH